ncbi:MAG TPA: hypothetical protein VGC09_00410 [Rhodopila sp.]
MLSRDYEVVNPNSPEHQAGYKERGFKYTKEVRSSCDAVVFIRFPSAMLGAGVAAEVADFRKREMPIWEMTLGHLEDGSLTMSRQDDIPINVLNQQFTREETAIWRARPNGGRTTPPWLAIEEAADVVP